MSKTKYMTVEIYIKERVDNQIDWYSKKSTFNKQWFITFSILTIVCSALVPLVVNYSQLIASILSVIVIISTSVNVFMKYNEKWINYRQTSEGLKKQKMLFMSNSIPYNCDNSLQLLVESIEAIISNENTKWSYIHTANQNNQNQ